VYAIGWGLVLRRKAKSERATEKIYEVHGLLQAISLVLIPALSLSPFHLLWMFPTSYLLGFLSIFFPLNLFLWPLASLYGSFWYIGLPRGEPETASPPCHQTARERPRSRSMLMAFVIWLSISTVLIAVWEILTHVVPAGRALVPVNILCLLASFVIGTLGYLPAFRRKMKPTLAWLCAVALWFVVFVVVRSFI
jgi:hypothetical protein